MASTPEGKIKDMVKKWLKKTPNTWYYMPVQNGMGVTGIPDFVGCMYGVMFGIETKAEGRGTTPAQDLQIQEIQKAGGVAMVVRNQGDMFTFVRLIAQVLAQRPTFNDKIVFPMPGKDWGTIKHAALFTAEGAREFDEAEKATIVAGQKLILPDITINLDK